MNKTHISEKSFLWRHHIWNSIGTELLTLRLSASLVFFLSLDEDLFFFFFFEPWSLDFAFPINSPLVEGLGALSDFRLLSLLITFSPTFSTSLIGFSWSVIPNFAFLSDFFPDFLLLSFFSGFSTVLTNDKKTNYFKINSYLFQIIPQSKSYSFKRHIQI